MGSLKDPKTWIPHINPKDCSKKVCNIYCTKWCKYVILSSPPPPPPPPSPLVNDGLGGGGGSFMSTVVIVIIILIGTLLLLIGYYIIISRYCSRNNNGASMMIENQETHDHEVGVHGHADEHAIYVPWLVLGKGLDEALINSIAICKYKRGDGLVTCTDCSVCLGEFRENESLRLLPKCCHAFHVTCIDTWFKTHSNCPLCRANVCFEVGNSSIISPSTPPPPPPPPRMTNESSRREVRDESERKIARSKSMDHYLCQTRVSEPKVMFFDQGKNMVQEEEVGVQADAESSRDVSNRNNLGLNIVDVSHFGMKRSYSSGRYSFTRVCIKL